MVTRRPLLDVAIVGAGPYGLAAAAHLGAAGLEVQVFGEEMEFWRRHMPAGMFLRSSLRSSHIADPDRRLTLDTYQQERGRFAEPVPLDCYVEYGHWFRERAVPDLRDERVAQIDRDGQGFRIVLEHGGRLSARRVVVAAGIAPFAWRPPEFQSLPRSVSSHSSEHSDFREFSGKRVLVVGGGQSALESAALLHESGAEVEVVTRSASILLFQEPGLSGRLIRHVASPPTDLGPHGWDWLVAAPDLYRKLPSKLRLEIEHRCLRPAGAAWLRSRISPLAVTTGRPVLTARSKGRGARVRLSDGSVRDVDHVLLATGYRVDIARYTFLPPKIVAAVRATTGYAVLGPGLESDVSGLHFLGAPAAASFGPVMRFVAGTWYAARALTRRVLDKPPRPFNFSW